MLNFCLLISILLFLFLAYVTISLSLEFNIYHNDNLLITSYKVICFQRLFSIIIFKISGYSLYSPLQNNLMH